MKNLLFVDDHHDLARIAQLTVARWGAERFTALSAGVQPKKRSASADTSFGTVDYSEYSAVAFDLVITIGAHSSEYIAMAPGLPPVIRWDDIDSADATAFDTGKCLVEKRVQELVSGPTAAILVENHALLADIVNSMHYGVIAHDLHRRVFLFSKGAEAITGVTAAAVLGKDCHQLFIPRLCGASCVFSEGEPVVVRTVRATYNARFMAGDGDHKTVQVTRQPMVDSRGTHIGVVVTFSDTTRLAALERRLHETESFAGIIGGDHRMLELYDLIQDLSDNNFPVVISGESGTGKELVAAAIHNESLRRDHLFVPVNCGALPEGMLESELFGHCRGAFTGAIRDKKGRFELAHKGTLFLDEIGDLTVQMQVKLLRVLQEGVVEPLGSEVAKTVDVRILCATNRNLRDMVARGTFREDLYYRIAVVPVEMPALRDRRNDIPLLTNHFLEKNTGRLSRQPVTFSDTAMAILLNYAWPGNVRQLQNVIQFALIKCRESVIMPVHLPPEILEGTYAPAGIQPVAGKVGRRPKLTEELVQRSLKKSGGNKAKAARLLGVGRATLYNFINTSMRQTADAS